MYCTKCGKMVSEQDMFCPNCGSEVVSVEASASKGESKARGFHISERTAWISTALSSLLVLAGVFLPFLVISFWGMRESYSVFTIVKENITDSKSGPVYYIASGVIAVLLITELLLSLCRCRMKGISIVTGTTILLADFGFYHYLGHSLYDGDILEIAHQGFGFYLIMICAAVMIICGFQSRKIEEVKQEN